MSANHTFVQALADASGRPVEVSPVTEATTLGAAFLAGLAVGMWDHVEQSAGLWRPARRVEPVADVAAVPRLRTAEVARRRRTRPRVDPRAVRPRVLKRTRRDLVTLRRDVTWLVPSRRLDESFEPEASQVVGGLRARVGTVEQRFHLGAEAPVGEADDGVHEHAEGAGQGHDRGSPNARAETRWPSWSEGCATCSNNDVEMAQPDRLSGRRAAGRWRHGLGLELVEVAEAALAAEIAGGVDDGLDAQRPSFFQVLLDP